MLLSLPGYKVKALSNGYPLQTAELALELDQYTAYSRKTLWEGALMGQFSIGITWFILFVSCFFLFKNRLSDMYCLWDTVQLLYLLMFLDLQNPPNLN